MKVFMTGGTGFVGSYMTRQFTRLGHEVIVLTRSAAKGRKLPAGASVVKGDPKKPGSWQEKVGECDVIINLAGVSIFTPWTEKARRAIMESRVLTTRYLVDALAARQTEAVLLNGSAVGYYGGYEDDTVLDESSPPGSDFLSEVGQNWEAEARRAEAFGVRVVLCRFGIVMGKEGGALEKMVTPFRYFLGSPLGSGKQWFPWIHEEDLFRIMLFLAENKHIAGPVNCTAPNPVRNEEMTRLLAKALQRFVILPAVPGFVLKTVLGEFGDVLLKGQRAVPKRLLDEGFQFKFPTFYEAIQDLLK
jgi:uncharacterized protein (TIGR01777 family)